MFKKLWSRVVEINREASGDILVSLIAFLAAGCIAGLSGDLGRSFVLGSLLGFVACFSGHLFGDFIWGLIIGLVVGGSFVLGAFLGATLSAFPLPTLSVLGVVGLSMGSILYLRRSRAR